MLHKISVIFGRSECGKTGVRMTRSWDNTTCPDCLAKRIKLRKLKDYKDDEYIGSFEEKMNYKVEEEMRYEAEIAEAMENE